LLVAGVPTRRIEPDTNLPFILEADLLASAQSNKAIERHDPLSSCYWPAAVPLARLVSELASPNERHLELGCGTGLCSLAASARGASCVATDVSDTALALTAAAAAAQNLVVDTQQFDAMDSTMSLPRADVLILSDLFVTEGLARAHARRVVEACRMGFKRICVVDPGRTTRATFLDTLDELGCTVATHGGFAPAEVISERARRGNPPRPPPAAGGAGSSTTGGSALLLLLDTSEGAPVAYEI
jgi:predicted nicotinamide N-methyase